MTSANPMSPDEIAVLEVNSAFYRAITDRDIAAMEDLWARDAPVACVHPGWDALRGREAVMRSWRDVIGGDAPRITATSASAHVLGAVAFVV
jgi:ketosteroid isomerase-like protein